MLKRINIWWLICGLLLYSFANAIERTDEWSDKGIHSELSLQKEEFLTTEKNRLTEKVAVGSKADVKEESESESDLNTEAEAVAKTKIIAKENVKLKAELPSHLPAVTDNQSVSVISSGIPKGFDDLLAPQIALVDIYFNGQPLLSSMLTYTPDWLRFERPEEIVGLLSELTDQSKILEKLRTKLAPNSAQICYYKSQRDCGNLSPEIAGVIFDESLFRLDLFINPNYINQTRLQIDQYLPASTSQLSFINSISLAATGGEKIENAHTLQLSSVLGYQNYRLQMNIDNDSENQTRLDQLSFVYDYRDIAYEIGSFKSFTQANGFYTQRDFIGARIQTSLSSRTDLEQVSGSAIFVFLSERSRVDVFKDGQLIDSQNYDAGNQEIDTRNFPDGAYNIELKITGVSGRESNETHFYSKSLRLPPLGETLYFAEFGVPESLSDDQQYRNPHAESHSVLRAGLVSRLSENLGLNASFVANSDDFSGEFGSFVLADKIRFQNNYAVSKRDGLGSFYQLDFNYRPFIFTASYRKTDRQDQVNYDLGYELLQNDSRQVLLNVAIPFDASTINVFARESQRIERQKTRVFGASWRKNIYRGIGNLIDFSVDATQDDIETRVLFGFNMRFFSQRVDVDLSARQNHKRLRSSIDNNFSNSNGFNNKGVNNHVDRRLRLAFKNQSESYGRLSNVFEVNQEELQTTASFKSELNNEHGYSRVELEQVRADGDKRVGYSMTGRFNIVASEGKVAIGGNRRNSAGVMINLESIESDSLSFVVIINGVERAKIDAGKSRFIALQPYETYQIVLSPRGETLVNYDNKPRVVTLYPGNIENMAWQINSVKVVIMQVLNTQGQPVANARLKDFKGYARTDDLGWIQLRLEKSGELSFVNQNGQACRVNVSDAELTETVNYLSEKQCQ
jgi:hypothetical protein